MTKDEFLEQTWKDLSFTFFNFKFVSEDTDDLFDFDLFNEWAKNDVLPSKKSQNNERFEFFTKNDWDEFRVKNMLKVYDFLKEKYPHFLKNGKSNF